MSKFENGMSINDWNMQSNGLYRSSSLPIYKTPLSNAGNMLYNSTNINPSLNNNLIYQSIPFELPIIYNYQPSKMIDNELNLRNQRKDELIESIKKLFKYRGLPPNYFNNNNLNDSWNEFFKRREREK